MNLLTLFFLLFTLSIFAQDTTAHKYDPCNDPLLLKLAQKDSLTDTEMNTYVQLRKLCDESKRSNELNQTLKESQENVRTSLTAYYVIAAIGLIVSLIFLVAQ